MSKILPPEKIFNGLFQDMHASGIWSDGKRIADIYPKSNPAKILDKYKNQKRTKDFDLKVFVDKNFGYAKSSTDSFTSDTSSSVKEHINVLWDHLMRKADKRIEGDSLIPLPNPYIVPGGRFQEIYYWDSYFTMLGLLESGRIKVMESMLDNFAYLIDEIGHIPNGNRSYFVSRSQPPFFASMVQLLAKAKNKKVLVKYLPSLVKEYEFWMKGAKGLKENKAKKRVANINGVIVNRYFDNKPTPRSEMYGDDLEIVEKYNGSSKKLFLDLKSACESGWDFSSRWLQKEDELHTIQTTNIIPVDLNCLIYFLEKTIAKAYSTKGKKKKAKKFEKLAKQRKKWINENLWHKELKTYVDYNIATNEQSKSIHGGMAFPLYFYVAPKKRAAKIAKSISKNLLRKGGVVTTPIKSGQQWDAPNGWAPLQWIAFKGLMNYGEDKLANKIRKRWLGLNTKVFKKTGKMLEKYDVEDLSKETGGGEYPVQDGFGWTNGVFLAMQNNGKNKL